MKNAGTAEEIFNKGPLKKVKIECLKASKKNKTVDIELSADKPVPERCLDEAAKAVAVVAGLHTENVRIKILYRGGLDERTLGSSVFRENVIYVAAGSNPATAKLLEGCTFKLDGGRLLIVPLSSSAAILGSNGTGNKIAKMISERYGVDLKIIFEDPETCEGDNEKYFKFKRTEEEKVSAAVSSPVYGERNDSAGAAVNEAEKKSRGKSREKSHGSRAASEADPGSRRVIFGKPVRDEAVKMSDVDQNSGITTIEGTVFATDIRNIRGGRKLLIFDMTDNTGSLSVKMFLKPAETVQLAENIHEGAFLVVRGEAQYDRFNMEVSVMAKDVSVGRSNIRMDGAPEKRVELHLHTQMSALDAVTPVSEYVKRAALWGHKAMAVTDHGVIQAFPEAAEAAAKYGVKVIYGVECYLCEDAGSVVMKPAGQSLETDYVVFDVETTGLDPDKDRIIELGAVKVSGGVITEGYGTYVDPGIPVPEKITGLTGIDDDKVRGAPPVEEVVKGLAAFAGDAVLVAHNAPFDMGFIGKAAASAGIKISNTVLDTLQLSRALYPEMKSHRLNVLASYFNISLPNHHRAEDDCRATAGIMLKLLEKLKEQGIEDLDKAGGLKPDNHFAARNDSWHAIILVRNRTGLRNLYKLISISHLDYFYKKPRMPRKIVSELREGLILGTACEAGELFRAIATGKDERRINEIADFYDYYEIQPTGNNMFLTGEESPETGADEYGHSIKTVEDIQNINRRIYELGRKKGKPVAATGDVHFLDPQDEYFRRIIMAGQGYEDADRQPPLYFKTTGEMLEEFSYLGEAAAREVVVVNTAAIANMVDDGLRPIPEGSFTPSIEGAEAEVEKLALANARAIYGDPLPELVDTRLRRELDSVITHGFAIMYLIAEKLVSKSMSDGYTVCSRGSVGSSFLATMCGITEVNPLTPHYVCPSCRFSEFHEDGQYGSGFDMPPRDCPRCGTLMRRDGQDIPFETFLGFHGEKTPDIDLNFSGEYQIKAHKYVEELFGPGHTFKAGTIGTIRDKTAYGFVKKYLESKGMTVTNAEMKRLIKGCTGIRRTTGQHPGGIVVIPEEYEIYDFSPVQHPADNTDSDVVTTHFDFTSLHDTILKFDILGHDDPTMIRELEDTTGVRVQDIPIPDEKVMRLFKDAGPLDVDKAVYDCDLGVIALPELGTKMSRAMVREARPETFLDLIQIMGLSHGTDVWIGNARELIRNGTCTISEVIGTRDSIMTGLIRYGLASDEAFQITESVRKGRGLTEKQEEIMREHRVPEWYIDSCKKIKYMFPKAHAAAYAISALRMGWFKIYYPKEFYAAYYTVRRNEFSFELMCRGVEVIKKNMKEIEQKGKEATDKENNTYKMLEIVLEMYARGIGFVPADVYKSDAFKFRITPEGIRPPLVSLQGLGESAAQNIARLREEGRFNSVEDLCIKARISKSVADTLRQNGCLEGIPETSQLTLF